jgi:hypothetical protein
MKLAVAVVTLLAAAAALTGTAVAGSATPPCTPKVTTIGGKPAVINCGPATATVRIGGKTYSFKNGFCQNSPANKETLELSLGTTADTKKPVSSPFFNLTATTSFGAVNADYGGKTIVLDSIVSLKGKVPSSGTFAGRIWAGPGRPRSPAPGTATGSSLACREPSDARPLIGASGSAAGFNLRPRRAAAPPCRSRA